MTVGHTAGRARGCNRRARNPACIARTVPAPGTRYIQLKITRQIKYVLKEDCKQRNLLNFKCYQYQVCFTGTLLYRLFTIKQSFGSVLVSMRIRIQHFRSMWIRMRIQIQDFDYQK